MALLLVLTTPLLAQQPTEEESRTWGQIDAQSRFHWSNGKAWELLDAQPKIALVSGIENGMMLLTREMRWNTICSDRAAVDKQLHELMIKGFRMSDVVEQVDAFYSDSSNLRIPIVDAYQYAMKKMHGAKQRELEDYAAELRRTYNK